MIEDQRKYLTPECSGAGYEVFSVNVKDLHNYSKFIAKEKPKGLVPITRNRAESLSANPAAEVNDIGLMVGETTQGECAGYFGLLPGWANLFGQKHKISWTCSGFVSEKFRNGIASKRAFERAMEQVETIIATGNSVEAEQLYQRLGYSEVNPVHTINIEINIYQKIMERIILFGKKLLRIKLDNKRDNHKKEYAGIGYFIAKILGGRKLPRVEYHECKEGLSKEARVLLDKQQDQTFFRSSHTVKWMLESDWWSEDNKPNEYEKAYYFYLEHKRLKYRVFDIQDKQSGKNIGFAIFSIVHHENITVKLLDSDFFLESDKRYLIPLIFRCVAEEKAHSLLVAPEIYEIIKRNRVLPFKVRKLRSSYFFWSKNEKIKEALFNMKYRMTDGDTAFW